VKYAPTTGVGNVSDGCNADPRPQRGANRFAVVPDSHDGADAIAFVCFLHNGGEQFDEGAVPVTLKE